MRILCRWSSNIHTQFNTVPYGEIVVISQIRYIYCYLDAANSLELNKKYLFTIWIYAIKKNTFAHSIKQLTVKCAYISFTPRTWIPNKIRVILKFNWFQWGTKKMQTTTVYWYETTEMNEWKKKKEPHCQSKWYRRLYTRFQTKWICFVTHFSLFVLFFLSALSHSLLFCSISQPNASYLCTENT